LWIEEGVSNVVTVLDAVGSERAAAVSELIGVTVGIGLAATHPDRVAALVLVDPWCGSSGPRTIRGDGP
jgi:pimeloyl-ACP methyl ester carboxylesterase